MQQNLIEFVLDDSFFFLKFFGFGFDAIGVPPFILRTANFADAVDVPPISKSTVEFFG
jgi:hypothetical protein